MCVIAIAEDERPSEAEVRAMWEHNSDGGGYAWREDGKVHWAKGQTVEQMVEASASLPFPFVLHFRIQSCGGAIDDLTHPFVIDADAPIIMEGATSGAVLFHNGHWPRYEFEFKDALYKAHGQIEAPSGPWSDTRVMAWLAGNFGVGILNWIDLAQRLVVFSPTEIEVLGNGWDYYEKRYLVSNKYWDYRRKKFEPRTEKEIEQDDLDAFFVRESEARQQMRQRGFLGLPPASEAGKGDKPLRTAIEIAQDYLDGKTAEAPPLAAIPALRLVAGGTPLDELTFRGCGEDLGPEDHPQAAVQEAEKAQQQAGGRDLAGAAEGGSRDEAHQPAPGSRRSGDGPGPLMTSVAELGKWAKQMCDLRNPKVSDVREVISLAEGERVRRRALHAAGIRHMGEL